MLPDDIEFIELGRPGGGGGGILGDEDGAGGRCASVIEISPVQQQLTIDKMMI